MAVRKSFASRAAGVVTASGAGAAAAGRGAGFGAVAQAAESKTTGNNERWLFTRTPSHPFRPARRPLRLIELETHFDGLDIRRVSQLERLFLSLEDSIFSLQGYRNSNRARPGEDAGGDAQAHRLAEVAQRAGDLDLDRRGR